MTTYILSIDQGTTGSTVLIVDMSVPTATKVIGRGSVEFPQHYPQAGWVEHNLDEIWVSVVQASKLAVAAASQADKAFALSRIAAIGITNQRETLCTFDRKTSAPVAPAIVWQCRRSVDICKRLKAAGHEEQFQKQTGLVLDPYFTGTKITWLMENSPDAKRRVASGEAVFGTIETYLMHRLSGGSIYATEASNASRTLLFDIHKGQWSQELCEILGVPKRDSLPELKNSAALFGKTKGLGFLPDGIPIAGTLGDQQAALAGQACFDVGEAKCTYGTGAFLLLNLGQQAVRSKHGLLTTVAWSVDGKLTYAFEGAAFVAGAAVQFLRDQFGFFAKASEIESLASAASAAPHIYFVPALAGLGAPYWNPEARGAFLGLTRGTSKDQLAKATLEAIALQVCDLLDAMASDCGKPLKILRADGGAAANNQLMQIQADLCGTDVDRPINIETTAFGAAMFAGLGIGIFKTLDDLRNVRQPDRVFHPAAASTSQGASVAAVKAGWRRAINAVQAFATQA